MVTTPRHPHFGRCPCGGGYEQRAVEVRMTVDGTEILLPDVPQGACPRCGSRVYRRSVLEEIERVMRSRPPSSSSSSS